MSGTAVVPSAGSAPNGAPNGRESFSVHVTSSNGAPASVPAAANGAGAGSNVASSATATAAAANGAAAPPNPSPPVSAPTPVPSSGGGGGHAHSSLVNKPTFLENPDFRFLIMDAPNDQNLASYIEVLKKKQVVVVARVCDPTYSAGPLLANGIKVLEVPFPDGDPPPPHVVDKWLSLVDQVFKHGGKNTNGRGVDLVLDGIEKPAIAIHCVAGLGRAPVLVAIALVEGGMEPFDAIAFIRKKRRGAINARQLKYIESYQPKRAAKGCCTVQ